MRQVGLHSGRGRVDQVNLFDEVIATVIATSAEQEEAVATYRLPGGTLVEVTAPASASCCV